MMARCQGVKQAPLLLLVVVVVVEGEVEVEVEVERWGLWGGVYGA